MRPIIRNFLLAVCVGGALLGSVAPVYGQAMDPAQKRATEKVVREYLLAHPEIIVEAMKKLETRRRVIEQRDSRKALSENRRQIDFDPNSPVGGNPKGDVTLVEFFDYRCGVCRRVHPVVAKLLHDDPKIRRVYKEWPILGPDSVIAARAALASRRQGKYLQFHDALMESRTKLTETTVLAIAERIGLDRARLVRDMRHKEIDAVFRSNFALAEKLRLSGTPSFVIGDTLIPGGRDLETMKHLVTESRRKKK